MAATKYQIFFRYINPKTGIAITNNLSKDYNETVEIIHQKHKMYAGTTEEQLEAEEERDNMLVTGNSPSLCEKYDMMFAFNGAKKYFHKKWVQGTWIKADDGSSVCTSRGKYVEETMMCDGLVTTKALDTDEEAGENTMMLSVKEPTSEQLKSDSTLADKYDAMSTEINIVNESSGVTADTRNRTYFLTNGSMYPYVVKDSYIRIPMSPWIKGSCYGSLEAAIQKCKTLVASIGIQNVKLVKLVAIRQKIKIV